MWHRAEQRWQRWGKQRCSSGGSGGGVVVVVVVAAAV